MDKGDQAIYFQTCLKDGVMLFITLDLLQDDERSILAEGKKGKKEMSIT